MQADESNANISVKLSSYIITEVKLDPTDRFDSFLKKVLDVIPANKQPALNLAIKNYRTNNQLNDFELHKLQRLLGLYSRIKYGQDAMKTLAQLVAVPTFKVEGLEQNENPEFIKIGKIIAGIANEFNLAFRNIDNHVFEITLKGQSDEVVGLHAHVDVVPVTPSLWVLDDGTKLNPFKLTHIDNRMYGRGTEDDKNGIVVTLYAMKVVQEENLPLMQIGRAHV